MQLPRPSSYLTVIYLQNCVLSLKDQVNPLEEAIILERVARSTSSNNVHHLNTKIAYKLNYSQVHLYIT